jgi:ribonuclease HII
MKRKHSQNELFGEIPRNQRWGENWARENGWTFVAGVDEVGRGCLAGPVVAAAVVLPAGHGIKGIADSKKLKATERERLFTKIIARGCCASMMVGNSRIDEVNILRSTMEAMAGSIVRLCRKLGRVPDCVLVDGPHIPRAGLEELRPICIPIKHGDSLSENIAAASIVAKVMRDHLMRVYDGRFEGYGFARHKGYGTPHHLEALQRLGPCVIHRLTFAGVVQGSRGIVVKEEDTFEDL